MVLQCIQSSAFAITYQQWLGTRKHLPMKGTEVVEQENNIYMKKQNQTHQRRKTKPKIRKQQYDLNWKMEIKHKN